MHTSGEKVHYELRPAKQVERRMLVDAFQILLSAGFPIRDYQYTGFGSFYFVDFVMLHKLLGITKLLSIEHSDSIENRVNFNKPFKGMDIKIAEASEVISELSADRQHILWLDYDFVINASAISDVRSAANRLSVGSILLVTIDAEPPGPPSDGIAEWAAYYREELERYLPANSPDEYFAKSKLVSVNTDILIRAIREGVGPRPDVDFIPLFNFVYADGHKMITIGGMIGNEVQKRQIEASALKTSVYYRDNLSAEPYEIKVPKITRKERHHLDSNMPCPEGWVPDEFEISKEEVEMYREIYRFFPAYAELLL